jgi:hypothetical protein
MIFGLAEQPSFYLIQQLFEFARRAFLKGTFPNYQGAPSVYFQLIECSLISRNIPFNLLPPKFRPGRRPLKVPAIVLVPETALNLNRSPVLRKDQVWLASKT